MLEAQPCETRLNGAVLPTLDILAYTADPFRNRNSTLSVQGSGTSRLENPVPFVALMRTRHFDDFVRPSMLLFFARVPEETELSAGCSSDFSAAAG
jgi:hypothetical protein